MKSFLKLPFPLSQVTISMAAALCAYSSPNLAQSNTQGSIEKCANSLGTLAVSEGSPDTINNLGRYRLGSPATMLRMMIEESGCFTVVERGAGLRAMQQERALAGTGMLQEGSNVGGGQMQAADFVLTPAIQFAEETGGVGGAIGSLFGRLPGPLGAIGGIAGGVKFKEAETTILISDVRSGIQVASAEGKASKMNFSLGGWGWGGMGWASGGGYSKTPEGKLIAASLLDNYNQIVGKIRDKPSLVRATSAASKVNAANSIQATPVGAAIVVGRPVTVIPTAPVAVAQPAQQVSQQTPTNAAATAFVGNYSGSYIGEDQGAFNISILPSGMINGTVTSSKTNASFPVTGLFKGGNEITVIGIIAGAAVNFNGSVDASGTMQGQWASGAVNGVFIGKRQ
jgi:curli biogenesis system outer membrane secretion channel CsgG